MAMDSTGKQVRIGSKVHFRGRQYTIKNIIRPVSSRVCTFEFKEKCRISEIATETSIDLIEY